MIDAIRKLIDRTLLYREFGIRMLSENARLKHQIETERAERRLEIATTTEYWTHRQQLKADEIASLKIQLTGYRDTVEALTWERRLQGAVAKGASESLRSPAATR